MSSDSLHGNVELLEADRPYDGVERRVLLSPKATVTFYSFAPGAVYPRHEHPEEQVTIVEAGDIELSMADRTIRLEASGWAIVPGGVEHGARAGPRGARFIAVVIPPRSAA